MGIKKSLKYFCLLLASSFGYGAATAQVNAEQVIEIGRNVLSMDDYLLSIQYFNQAIKAKPYLAEPYFLRALAKLQLEDYSGAVEDCNRAIDRNKFITEAYKLRGFARQHLQQDSLAILDYDYGLEYNPTDKYFLFYKANAETQIKRFDNAEKTFSTLLKQYPNFDDGYEARSYMYLQKGDTTAAMNDIATTMRLNRSLINPYLMRAEIKSNQGKWQEAADDMDRAVELRPQEVSLYINRAYLRYNLNNYFGAMADYNYALELDPDNEAATFNRALLRLEVRDFSNAANDFSKVLELDPSNFHALYNRALIYCELNEYNKALADFDKIAARYPKFYPVYYAKADVMQKMGNTRAAFENYYKAEDMVKKYVTNPEGNPLDRPTIDAGKSNRQGTEASEDETEIDVMNRFNQLVTLSGVEEPSLSYNDKIKGRVQDRDLKVEPEPSYGLSLYNSPSALRSLSNYFRELDDINQRNYLSHPLYLSNATNSLRDSLEINRLFRLADDYTSLLSRGNKRPVDLLARGVVYATLKNYDSAISDFNAALEIDPDFTAAIMARGYVKATAASQSQSSEEDSEAALMKKRSLLQEAAQDFDKAISLNPRLIYAWFNKGNLYYALGDYTSAMECYTKAIEINSAFGEAYFNRGLSYLKMGNKRPALSDLSAAGELGVIGAYNLLKRMK